MSEFLAICEYFDITPADFFNNECQYPKSIKKIVTSLNSLSKEDLKLIENLVERLSK